MKGNLQDNNYSKNFITLLALQDNLSFANQFDQSNTTQISMFATVILEMHCDNEKVICRLKRVNKPVFN